MSTLKRAFALCLCVFSLMGLQWVNAMQGVMVHNVKARATFAMATTAAVYLTIMNHSDKAVTLTGVSVDESIAADAQLHTTVMEGDMMKMRQITDGIDVAPGAMVEFKSGSYHVMLMGLVKPLVEGASFDLTLTFANQPSMTTTVTVGAGAGEHSHHHHE